MSIVRRTARECVSRTPNIFSIHRGVCLPNLHDTVRMLIMAAMRSRRGHSILPWWFLLYGCP